MKILTDFHHADLYHSLHLLFEKRLGHKLYTVRGFDWHKNGYWKFLDDDIEINQQYLTDVPGRRGCAFPLSQHHNIPYRSVSMDEISDHDFDIIMPTVISNELPYQKIQRDFYPDAKLIRQAGNVMDRINTDIYKNIFTSSYWPYVNAPNDINKVFYHQEFDTDRFKYTPYENDCKYIRSFINHYHDDHLGYGLWKHYKRYLPEFDFLMHGFNGDDGFGHWSQVHNYFKHSMFTWHIRSICEMNYEPGYNVHYSLSMGRPPIVDLIYHWPERPIKILVDGVSCINIQNLNFMEVLQKIRLYSQPNVYKQLCDTTYETFKNTVDFDKEFEEKLKPFIENLI